MKQIVHLSSFFVLALLSLSLGCGSGGQAVPESTVSEAEELQRDLEYIIKKRVVGSEIVTIEENISSLQESNPEIAAKLQTIYPKLESAKGSAVAKLAKEMLTIVKEI